MTAGEAISRIQTVNAIRKRRMEQALFAARGEHQQAEADEVAAERSLELMESRKRHARDELAAEPGNVQAQIWARVSQDRVAASKEDVVEAKFRTESARLEVTTQVRAVNNQHLKMDQLDKHRARLIRNEARASEIREEDA